MKISKRLSLILILSITICLLIPLTAFADDIFSSTGTVAPEKDIYYVGDTVDITDYYRNKDTVNATNVSVEYYFRLDGANSVYSGSPINFGTIAGGTSKSHSFQYTFKESDIGEYRIGSKITYSTSGGGPFNEYSSGHNFIVELAPTPTPTPSETPTATPTDSPAPTITPTATPIAETPVPIETLAPLATEVAADASSANSDINSSAGILDTILGDSTLAMVVIIILAIVSILIIIIIILLIVKRRK